MSGLVKLWSLKRQLNDLADALHRPIEFILKRRHLAWIVYSHSPSNKLKFLFDITILRVGELIQFQ